MMAYSQEFYVNRYEKTIHSANTILSIVLEHIPAVHSAVDIGCGVGTWLSVLQKKGVKDIQGLDGSWVDQDLLAIPRDCFKQIDLSKSVIKLPQRYDLAISLEVAEHLPSDRAKEFVSSLTALSDYVLFSAAIPFQGGINHVNEQWQHYWVELFDVMDYVVHDFIRPKIWNDNQIPYWYRQNILLFSKQKKSKDSPHDSVGFDTWSMPLDLVHPDLYLKIDAKRSFKLFYRSLKYYISRKSRKFGKDSRR
jgi:cyclopropane fatty-acyl-phospholipid synthase-like methyltransferase